MSHHTTRQCPHCGRSFRSKNVMLQHVKVEHDLDKLVARLNRIWAHEELKFYRKFAMRRPAGIE